LGLTAEAASTVTFARLMGHQQASWTLLSSEWLSAEAAKAAGLVMSVFADEDLLSGTMRHADTLAALPLASLIQTKALLMRTQKEGLKAAVAEENAALDRLKGGAANLEAVKAFQEKRLPDFGGF
jgi:enoyl-CoA hydratase/carnithine racemase